MADIDQQPQEHLSGTDAAQKVHEIGQHARTVMLGTQRAGHGAVFRPMAIQTVAEDGAIYLLSSTRSAKNADIAADPHVMVMLANDDKNQYLSLAGTASVHTDRATIDAHWTAFANNWFDGQDDPRVSVICVRPFSGHYWDTQSSKVVAMAKMVLGAVTGGAVSDDGGVDGRLSFG